MMLTQIAMISTANNISKLLATTANSTPCGVTPTHSLCVMFAGKETEDSAS